jgi:hypothetical protein
MQALHSHFVAELKPDRSNCARGPKRKQYLPIHCALQHMIARFEAKFCVTFRFTLG